MILKKNLFFKDWATKNLTEKEIEKIKNIIKRTDSLAYSQELAIGLINRAKSIMAGSKFKKEAKDFLIGIADYMLNREY